LFKAENSRPQQRVPIGLSRCRRSTRCRTSNERIAPLQEVGATSSCKHGNCNGGESGEDDSSTREPLERHARKESEMDLMYVPALASFSGSASGTLAAILTAWITRRRKDRIRHTLRDTSQREKLYKGFIEEASRLYADALVSDKSEISKLVELYALIARMKILSSDAVIGAAEKAAQLIIETYLSPNRTFIDLPALIKEMDPLRDFSEACRRELQTAHRR